MSAKMKWVCPECWSENVSSLEWVDANTSKLDGADSERMFCNECDDEMSRLKLISYSARLEELKTECNGAERFLVLERAYKQELSKAEIGTAHPPCEAEFDRIRRLVDNGLTLARNGLASSRSKVLRRVCSRLGFRYSVKRLQQFIEECFHTQGAVQ